MKFVAVVTIKGNGEPPLVQICSEREEIDVSAEHIRLAGPDDDVCIVPIIGHWSARIVHPTTVAEQDCRGGEG